MFVRSLTLMVVLAVVPAPAGASEESPFLRTAARGATAVDRAAVLSRVRATSPTTARLRTMSSVARAKSLGRCFTLASVRYCLGQGFTEHAPNYRALAASPTAGTRGDLSFGSWAEQRAALTDAGRVKAEEAELAEAVAVLPAVLRLLGARDEHRAALGNGRQVDPVFDLLPANAIMAGKQTRQERSYWCGPATIQSIVWGSKGKKEKQSVWARRLGTTTGGSSIYNMVEQMKQHTTWLKPKDVRGHFVLDVSTADADDFYFYHQWMLGWRNAPSPVIEHPKLVKTSFRYLKYNHNGHFQVGRGYRTVGKQKRIQIFEVFNERDFRSTGNTTWGPREVSARALLNATLANSDHKNIGL